MQKVLVTWHRKQKAGRAGRRGLDDVGHVVLRIDLEEYAELRPLLKAYFEGRPEPVRSSFNLSWNSVISLIEREDRDRVREIVEKSFLAWHLDRMAQRHRDDAEGLIAKAEDASDNHKARRARKEAKTDQERG